MSHFHSDYSHPRLRSMDLGASWRLVLQKAIDCFPYINGDWERANKNGTLGLLYWGTSKNWVGGMIKEKKSPLRKISSAQCIFNKNTACWQPINGITSICLLRRVTALRQEPHFHIQDFISEPEQASTIIIFLSLNYVYFWQFDIISNELRPY